MLGAGGYKHHETGAGERKFPSHHTGTGQKEHEGAQTIVIVMCMTLHCPVSFGIRVVVLFLLLACCVSPVLGIEAALGETIPLSGYSPTSQTVYLFLTGPNLPVNGVMLNAITQRADEGHFTKVSVDGNDYWSYKWNTGNVGGRLDAGTYTVWVVNGPNDRSRLSQAEYRTLSVTLGRPSISVSSAGQKGGMEITSVPSGASVYINDQFKGTTPLNVPGLEPATYQVRFSLDGYYPFNTPVPIEAGRVSEVAATLALIPEPTAVVITAEQTPGITGQAPAATTATTATPQASGLLPALVLAGLIATGIARRRN